MTMKIDPKNADYTVKRGATGDSEPWQEMDTSNTLNMLTC